MILGIPRETFPGERRVALIPANLAALTKRGLEVLVEAGAGSEAGFADDEYVERGATLVKSRAELFKKADILAQVRLLGANLDRGKADLSMMREGQLTVGFADPLGAPEAAKLLAEKGVSALAMELIPRITRAQAMDALSSMATITGYKAVLLAAVELPRMFPMLMTAAGTVRPAKVFVIGAGVAGLQAIATARKLGAVVQGYDVRPAVREQVESLGARFVELDIQAEDAEDKGGYAKALGEAFYQKQRELLAEVVAECNVVISTAAIPGKPSPLLVTADAVKGMVPGSVIVDLAAERGGNCELSKADETVVAHGVTILGPTNLPATIPYHASQMYSKNLTTLLEHVVSAEGALALDREDEITAGALVAHGGQVVHPRLRKILGLGEAPPADDGGGGPPEERDEAGDGEGDGETAGDG